MAAVLPLDAARIAASPVSCGIGALAVVLALGLAARRGSGEIPAAPPWGFAICVLLAAPHAVGFQERYVFLPVAASSVALAALVRASGRAYPLAVTAMVLVSLAGTRTQWRDWREAARASERFTAELVRVARARPGEAIVVANAPFRVRGGSVAGDLSAALEVLDGPPSPVRAAAWVSYGEAMPETLVEPARLTGDGTAIEVGLRIGDGVFDRVVATGGAGSVATPAPGGIRLTIPRDKDIVVWNLGRLERAYTRATDRPLRGTREE